MKLLTSILAAAAALALASCASKSTPPSYSAPQSQGSYYAPSK